jgi:hypothetical protein
MVVDTLLSRSSTNSLGGKTLRHLFHTSLPPSLCLFLIGARGALSRHLQSSDVLNVKTCALHALK